MAKGDPLDGNDDTDRDDAKNPALDRVRAHVRGRVLAILGSEEAKLNPSLAIYLTFETAMPRGEARALIARMGPGLDNNPNSQKIIDAARTVLNPVSARHEQHGYRATPSEIVVAGRKRRGEM
jgi:hypothetical protein